MSLVEHPAGNYRFLPGISPYSCGVVASPGYEIVQVTFQDPPAYEHGFDRIAAFLTAHQRPKSALCAISLRSPRPFTFQGFADFNRQYTTILQSWGVFVGEANPIARTNIAPVVAPPAEPCLYGFSFTRPSANDSAATFVVAGAGELPEGVLARESIVALSDLTPSGLATKTRFVLDLMESRLRGLGVSWAQVTCANVYTVHALTSLLPELILPRMNGSSVHSVHWYYSRPPVEEIEYEMDLRGVQTELRVR